MVHEIDIVGVKLVKEGTFTFESDSPEKEVRSPNVVIKILQSFIGDRDREYMVALLLGTKLQLNKIHVVSIGSLNASVVHPREVFTAAIVHKAASVILAHNHPSGNVQPSNEDIQITERLKEAGKILGIEVLDHIVVSDTNYYSFAEHGQI